MSAESYQRKISAIFSADVAGYSRLMGDDEEATVRTLTRYREVMSNLIERHRGRVVDSPGDNLLAEFASVVDALHCAWDVQEELAGLNAALDESRRMLFRIGSEEALACVGAMLRDADPEKRLEAAKALEWVATPAVIPFLRELLDDRCEVVREDGESRVRICDVAAAAVADYYPDDCDFDADASVGERDRVIELLKGLLAEKRPETHGGGEKPTEERTPRGGVEVDF